MPTNNPTQVISVRSTTSDLAPWLRNKLIIALLPVAQGFGRKMIARLSQIAGTAFITYAATNGVHADVETISGAVLAIGAVAFDVLISIVSFKLHLVAKPDTV